MIRTKICLPYNLWTQQSFGFIRYKQISGLLPVGYIDVDIKDMTSRFANDVVATCAFGLKVDSHSQVDNEFYTLGKEAAQSNYRQLLIFFGYSSFPALMPVSSFTFSLRVRAGLDIT